LANALHRIVFRGKVNIVEQFIDEIITHKIDSIVASSDTFVARDLSGHYGIGNEFKLTGVPRMQESMRFRPLVYLNEVSIKFQVNFH
jgi:hypothetical protein